MPTIDIGSVLNRAFDFYKTNISTLLITCLLGGIISNISGGILAGPMCAGVFLVTLGLLDKKTPAPVIGDLFNGFNYFVPTLVLFVLLSVVMMISAGFFFFCPLIGFPVGLALGLGAPAVVMFAPLLIVDRNMEVIPAIQASIELVKTNFWVFLGLFIVASVVASLGVFLCGMGLLLTAPMMPCMLAVAFRDLHPAQAQG